jgi:pantetheine-phosphate adenylyltransferase
MTTVAVIPGSFDPITNGHVDVIERAASQLDEIVVAVLENPSKRGGMFDLAERIGLIEAAIEGLHNVRVERFEGLLVDFCTARDITMVVKGLRAVSDFEYELQMAQMNQQLAGVETLFLPTSPEWSYLSSSLVKEVARYGGDVAGLLPPAALEAVLARVAG